MAADVYAAEPIDYTKQVHPIFVQHCLKCHGPDEQESGLRVDRRASLLRGGELGEPALLPGKGADSFLVHVVSGQSDDLKMPPEGKLTKEQVATLRTWIDQGAAMPKELSGEDSKRTHSDHWSFQPLATIAAPKIEGDGAENPIDAFVLHRLQQQQLEFSPLADRRTLIRRLYLVMHGLPPTPEQIERFLEDDSTDAWPNLVDEVLKSPRYGERWARHWLDLVRFGETHGFETNRERPHAWRFRDFVIESFNSDKPYDQFVREQIAGDALGQPIGTGFLVAGSYDLVKGGGDLQAIQRMNELDDMINTTGVTFLGLTLGCARCHNHKFDPVTQSDYYAVQAIFAGVRHGDRALPSSPETAQQIAALDREAAALRQRLVRYIRKKSDESPGDQATRPAVAAKLNTEVFKPQQAKYVRFSVETTNQGQPCIDELEVFSGEENVALASAGATASASGSLPGYAIHKLEHINDGKYGNSHSWICNQQQGWVQIEWKEPTTIDRIVWARDRQGRYGDRLAVRYKIEIALEPDQWRPLVSSKDRRPFTGKKKPANQIEYDFSKATPEEAASGKQWIERIAAVKKQQAQLRTASMAYIGTFAQPGPTHRLYRGEPDQKREVVAPGAVSTFVSLNLAADTPEQKRRLALAEWIASADNPLTTRVIVNRLWQHHFGAGLVDTPSDFGANGSPPTHPQLLDWLANTLITDGWSMKSLHRRILLSQTWRQDSRPRPAAMAVDASSRLLWRFPPRRLEAEAIRDSMLSVSGVLDLTMGGPGFSGFEVQAENVRHFFPKKKYGPDDWRRMIYMTKVRQEQESVFGAFDCPDGSQVAPKRSRSTTPLQAFNLLNSTFALQQADLLAARLKRESPNDDASRAGLAYALTFGRPATAEEADQAFAFASEYGWAALCRALLNANEFVFIP